MTVNKCSISKFADDWIWTADLWYRKWPVYQLSQKHCLRHILFNQPNWLWGSFSFISFIQISASAKKVEKLKNIENFLGQKFLFLPSPLSTLSPFKNWNVLTKRKRRRRKWERERKVGYQKNSKRFLVPSASKIGPHKKQN